MNLNTWLVMEWTWTCQDAKSMESHFHLWLHYLYLNKDWSPLYENLLLWQSSRKPWSTPRHGPNARGRASQHPPFSDIWSFLPKQKFGPLSLSESCQDLTEFCTKPLPIIGHAEVHWSYVGKCWNLKMTLLMWEWTDRTCVEKHRFAFSGPGCRHHQWEPM